MEFCRTSSRALSASLALPPAVWLFVSLLPTLLFTPFPLPSPPFASAFFASLESSSSEPRIHFQLLFLPPSLPFSFRSSEKVGTMVRASVLVLLLPGNGEGRPLISLSCAAWVLVAHAKTFVLEILAIVVAAVDRLERLLEQALSSHLAASL
ncbi:hypothetical protein KC340_g137 [Hortaea werneckii]|nr:hypothetical protein KC340_g137 [Hortaea werneckii]